MLDTKSANENWKKGGTAVYDRPCRDDLFFVRRNVCNIKKQLIMVSFMLFSMFFGAGNLIFPPFLGQNAGSNAIYAIIAFLITAVLLPVLGIIVVAKFKGLDNLSSKVGFGFASIYTF